MQTYFFVAFKIFFYAILFDLEIAGNIIKLYQAQLLFCEMLPSKFYHAMTDDQMSSPMKTLPLNL